MAWLLIIPFVLACGDDGAPPSSGSGDGSSGAVDSSSSGEGATSLASSSSSEGGSTGASSSSGVLDGTTTGGEPALCDVCAEGDVCVLDFTEKNCLPCGELQDLPLNVVCVPGLPEACNGSLDHTRACALALCGTPHAGEIGCECGEQGDFICAVSPSHFSQCDYWDHESICGRDDKCVPARDDQYQPLPYTECHPPRKDVAPLGAPCTASFDEDPCDPTAYCDAVDPATMMGVCRSLCVGDEGMPACVDPAESCVPFVEGQPQLGGVCRPS